MHDSYDLRRNLTIKVLDGTHAGLKVQAAQLGLPMQTILEELICMVAQGDPYIIEHMSDLARQRKMRKMAALSSTDADTLLQHIEDVRAMHKSPAADGDDVE